MRAVERKGDKEKAGHEARRLCRHVVFSKPATQRGCARLRATEMTTDVSDSGSNETGRDISNELRQVVVDGIGNR